MDDLLIAATNSSPGILFSPRENRFRIEGQSFVEHTAKFYAPVFAWLKEYAQEPDFNGLSLTIVLIYFNSSSFKVLLNLFEWLEETASRTGKKIVVHWCYHKDNEMAKEHGLEFQGDMCEVDFHMIEVNS
ncbi:MAG: DUF1987 domain-containing protein [Magnetococcales bacterium]|nr:DUF1987 domain-containing protein [Magnetococcales bacterium]